MYKLILFLFVFFLFSSEIEAKRCACCGCRRYMDPTMANYDGNPYGYIDNINYPDTYALPINYYFNYCPPCRQRESYNVEYLENCIRYTNAKKCRVYSE